MHRPLVLALILALAAAVAALWFFSRGDVPPPAGTNTTTQAEQQGAAVTENVALPQGGPVAATQRTAVTYPQDGLSHFRAWSDNVLISGMHARLFAGMLLRSPRLLLRKLQAKAAKGYEQAESAASRLVESLRAEDE